MKTLKKTLLAAVTLMNLLMMLTGCSKSIVGTWEQTDWEGAAAVELAANYGDARIEFVFAETEVTMTAAGEVVDSDTFAYTLEENKIVIEDGTTIAYTLKGNTLRLDWEGGIMVLTRK